jgi:tetratricopeptide (TPR) repeat protein
VKKESKGKVKSPDRARLNKILLGVVAVMLLGVTVLGGYVYYERRQVEDRYEEKLNEAYSFYEKEEYSNAVESYEEAVEISPESVEAYQNLLTILVKKNLLAEAEGIAEKSGEYLNGEEQGELYKTVANSYYDKAFYEKSESLYSKIIELGGVDEWLSFRRLAASVKAGDLSLLKSGGGQEVVSEIEDIEEAKVFLELNSRYEELKETDQVYNKTLFARDAIQNGFPAFAVEMLVENTKEEEIGEYWDAQFLLARAYHDLGSYSLAKVHGVNARALGSESPEFQLLMARNSVKLEEINKAFDYYDQFLQFSEDEELKNSVMVEYSRMLIANERYIETRELLDSGESTGEIALMKSKLHIEQEKYAEALAVLQTIKGKVESDWGYYNDYTDSYLLAYLGAGQIGNAENVLDMVEKESAYYYYYKGMISKERGEDYKDLFIKAIEKDLEGNISERASKEL